MLYSHLVAKKISRSGRRRPILEPGQIFCPVGRALDVIGDRWTLVLVRHLLSGPCGFQELRERTGIAPRVLSSRLRELVAGGFIESSPNGARPGYRVTERGRSLEPIISAIARWYLRHGLDHLQVDASRFSATSARSILESLPFLLREDRAAGADLTFEIRLTGLGGGVWTVRIIDGICTVRPGFAEHADVRYTADTRVWCSVALGIADAGDMVRQGRMSKDGGRAAMDYYFHQIARDRQGPAADNSGSERGATGAGASPTRSKRKGSTT
jgi:DNA-binding HxlR family transcriptional regulator